MAAKIVCFSGNPSLDRRLKISSLRLGEVNRAAQAAGLPGGKAAHVAMACVALGWRPVWTGFLGGAIGEECATGLRELGIDVQNVSTRSPTRVNLELIEDSGVVTEILEPGAAPTTEEESEMLEFCSQKLASDWKSALLLISGSLPRAMRTDFYASLISAARAAGSKVFLDTSGDWLLRGIEAQPDFVKVNAEEAGSLVNATGSPLQKAVASARELMAKGVGSAAITVGKEGLVWKEGRTSPLWLAQPPALKSKSQVGCGDTTLAGFAHAVLVGMSGADAARFAAACGAANCLASVTARISSNDVQRLLSQVQVKLL